MQTGTLGVVALTVYRSGPTGDNPKFRHFYWLLNRLTPIMTGGGGRGGGGGGGTGAMPPPKLLVVNFPINLRCYVLLGCRVINVILAINIGDSAFFDIAALVRQFGGLRHHQQTESIHWPPPPPKPKSWLRHCLPVHISQFVGWCSL